MLDSPLNSNTVKNSGQNNATTIKSSLAEMSKDNMWARYDLTYYINPYIQQQNFAKHATRNRNSTDDKIRPEGQNIDIERFVLLMYSWSKFQCQCNTQNILLFLCTKYFVQYRFHLPFSLRYDVQSTYDRRTLRQKTLFGLFIAVSRGFLRVQ